MSPSFSDASAIRSKGKARVRSSVYYQFLVKPMQAIEQTSADALHSTQAVSLKTVWRSSLRACNAAETNASPYGPAFQIRSAAATSAMTNMEAMKIR